MTKQELLSECALGMARHNHERGGLFGPNIDRGITPIGKWQ